MPKLVPGVGQQPKHKKRVKPFIIGGALLVIIAAGLTYAFIVRPALDKAAEERSALLLDTRTDATKTATTKADTQANTGDLPGAYATLNQAISTTGQNTNLDDLVSLYQTKASIAVNAGDKDTAIAAQKKAIELQPSNYKLVEGLGEIYSYLGDDTTAESYFAQAEAIAKKTPGDNEYHGVGTPIDKQE